MNHHVTSKEKIAEVAMKIALSNGVEAVSIRKVAYACNISIGSVYNYFKNKEELIGAISEAFWKDRLKDQDKVYRNGMGFTFFLEQYYRYLQGRLVNDNMSWIEGAFSENVKRESLLLLKKALKNDERINPSIWNLELNEDAFCSYVLMNIFALLQAKESNCRFFVFLLDHLLYGN